MGEMQKNFRGIAKSTIVITIVALVVLAFLLTIYGGMVPDWMKKLVGSLAGNDAPTSELCESFRTIQDEKNLTDLITLVSGSVKQCGGDTTEGAFRFNLSVPYIIVNAQAKLCGEHTYEIGWAPRLNRTVRFEDIEKDRSVVFTIDTRHCGFNGESYYESEYQDCLPENDESDLLVLAPDESGWSNDTCSPYSGERYWCYEEGGTWPNSHLTKFGIARLDPGFGTWALKRAGEDTVLCLILKT